MYRFIIIFITLLLPLAASASEVELPHRKLDLSPEAVDRGKTLYFTRCRVCHSLTYWHTKENPKGINAFIEPEKALESFGVVPPDLTIITKARGRRLNGALYIYQFMKTYHIEEDGTIKNRAFAKWTHTDGTGE
jgi:hypothetical protein